jgi:hypothetical protein
MQMKLASVVQDPVAHDSELVEFAAMYVVVPMPERQLKE